MATNPPGAVNLQIEVIPTTEAVLAPPQLVNVVRSVFDKHGFTVYLSAAPADVLLLPQVASLMDPKTGDITEPPPGSRVTVPINPVAKVFIPHESFIRIVEALMANYASWEAAWGEKKEGENVQ